MKSLTLDVKGLGINKPVVLESLVCNSLLLSLYCAAHCYTMAKQPLAYVTWGLRRQERSGAPS